MKNYIKLNERIDEMQTKMMQMEQEILTSKPYSSTENKPKLRNFLELMVGGMSPAFYLLAGRERTIFVLS